MAGRRAAAPADAVVAGVAEPGDVDSVRCVADAILCGVYRGDFAVALERAAAMFRVVAAGRRVPRRRRTSAARPSSISPTATIGSPADLTAAARRWRAGTLR